MTISLLRSPKAPDANADMGTHTFSYAMFAHHRTAQEANVINLARAFNFPLQTVKCAAAVGLGEWSDCVQFGVFV